MAKLVYGLNQSLDGYVDHTKLGPPVPAAFRHFIELVRGLTGLIYGRRRYDVGYQIKPGTSTTSAVGRVAPFGWLRSYFTGDRISSSRSGVDSTRWRCG
jgi:hypothetical protein